MTLRTQFEPVFPAAEPVAIIDRARGLMWAATDCLSESATYADAEAAVRKSTLLGHSDWRLPTIAELLSLVDYDRHEPACDEVLRMSETYYWTSTPAAWSASLRWVVYFNSGYSGTFHTDLQARVRAVRSWSGPLPGQ